MNKISTLFTALSVCALSLNAQEDVTATYLTNAGFDEEFNFKIIDTFNEINGDNVLDVYGWTKAATATYTVAGTIELGTELTVNKSNPIPTKGYQGSTGGVLALTTGWGEKLAYTQEITLPAGKYELSTVWYNAGTETAGTSLLGWIPDEGEAVMSDVNSYQMGAWVTETVTFSVLNDNTKGKIQIGYQAIPDKGSNFSAKLLFDYVKLSSYTVDKAALTAKIEEVKTLANASNATAAAKTYLEELISNAEAIAGKSNATLLEVLTEIETLENAITLCANTELSDLKVNDVTIAGFSADVLEYTYYMSPGDSPVVNATPKAAIAGASVNIATDESDPTITVITVSAGVGELKTTYKINFKQNYMAGWDANNDVTKSPYDAGWRTTDASVVWSSTPGTADTPDNYGYRDNLGVGRVFIHPQNHAIFSYPVNLEKGKAYVLTCSSAKMSGNNPRPTTFSVNSEADGTGVTIGTSTQNAAKWNSYTNHTVAVVAPADGTYYVLWQTAESDGDRSLAFNFMLIQSGKALEVTFDVDGGSPAPETQYLAKGAKVTEPEAPTKEGFEFDGWWYEEDGFPLRWNFDVAIEGNVALYAKWISPSSIGKKSTDNGLNVFSAENGIQVKANETTRIKIVSIVGQIIKTMTVEAGETFIGLPTGMYIVNGTKTVVR